MPHECDPRLQLARLACPGERLDAELANAFQHGGVRLLLRHLRQRTLLQHQTIQPQHTSREHRLLPWAPLDRVGALQPGRHERFDFPAAERRGEADAGVALAVIEVHSHDELLAREALGLGKMRAATIRQREAPFPTRALSPDPTIVEKRPSSIAS